LTTLDWTSAAISSYGYAALFVVSVLEGPIVTVIAAWLASRGLMQLACVCAIAVSGDLAGDLLLYGLGRSGRIQPWIRRSRFATPRRLRLLDVLQERFRTHPGKVLVLAKWSHAAGFLVLLGAGAARIPLGRFLAFNLLAAVPKIAVLVVLGYFAGATYGRIDFYLWLFSCVAFLAIATGVVVALRRYTHLEETRR
jgi:membrane protein DedA with SNARE-associated domain